MNLRLRDQSVSCPPHQHQNQHRHRHEQRVLKICLPFILLLAMAWISPTVLCSSSSSISSSHPHPHPHPHSHEFEPHETLSSSSSREGNKEVEQIKNSLPWRNSHFTFTNPSVLLTSQSQSKSPGSSSLSTSSVPATSSILSSWPLSLQPTFFSLLSSSSSLSSSPSATLNKDSKARSTFSMVGPGGQDDEDEEGDESSEDGLSSPLSLAPYLSYPYTLALHNRGVNANANANAIANDLQSTVGSHSHSHRDRDRNWKQPKQSNIFTVLQDEDKLQRHHRDLSTSSSSSSSSLSSSFPWKQNQNMSQDQNQRNRIIIANSIPTLNQIQNEEKFPPIPSTSLITTDDDESSPKPNLNGSETSSTKDWSLQFDEYTLCRFYEDYPPLVFQLHSCASCYMYMRDEISLFGLPSKKIKNVVNIPYLDRVWGRKIFKAFNDNGTIISANISDPENLLYKTFANQNAKQKWVDCCEAAQECCEKYQTTKDPQQRNSSTSIAKLPEESERKCQPTWDGWQCWGETAAEMQATATCPPYIYFMSEPPSCLITITKDCDREGDWLTKWSNSSRKMVPWTNYATCASAVVMVQQKRAHVHVMAYAVSIIALIPALIVFFVYKQLRVHRIILHQNLFFSMLINGLLVIAFKTIVILNELSTSDRTGPSIINQNGIGCRLLFILTKYSRMTNYMWMFCEGYYLHRLIAAAFAEQKSLLVFYLLGWVFPILPTAIYAGLRMYDANDRCWVVPEEAYEWVLNIPSLLSLLINLGFLINIIRVLVTKLRAATTSNEPSQYRKAVRATLVLLPLFGLHFVVTIYRPPSSSGSCEWIELYYYVNYVLDGLQGFLVALIFCYVNGEVVALFKRTYSRWKEQHSAGCERQPSRLNNRNGRGRSVVSTHYSSVPESPEPGSLTRLTITNTELNGAVTETDRLKKSCLMVNGKSNLNSHTILVTNVEDDENDTNGRGDWSEIKLDVGGSEADNNRLEMTQAFTLYPNLTSSSALSASESAGSPTSASAASIRASNNRVKNGASVSSEHQL